jgi:hypothetical protein
MFFLRFYAVEKILAFNLAHILKAFAYGLSRRGLQNFFAKLQWGKYSPKTACKPLAKPVDCL